MRLSELAGSGNSALDITGLTADSRLAAPGFLFAALPGVKGDGRDFIDDAVKKGAVAVLALPGTKVPPGVELIADENPRRLFAQMAARLYGRQPDFIAAVTGTNGKTSTVSFCRQLWEKLGAGSASIGTLGVASSALTRSGSLTTPDPVTLARDCAELSARGVTHLAVEASSHGLDQHRLDGLALSAGGFTNLTRDHLDYHGTMENYLAAKMRLFTELLPPGAIAILADDLPGIDDLADTCKKRGLKVWRFGASPGCDLRLIDQKPLPAGQFVSFSVLGEKADIEFPLAGAFQAENALMALGLVLAEKPDDAAFRRQALCALESLSPVRGRLELAGTTPNGAAVYVDYAHTPDGLKTVLESLRPHAQGKLHVVFGCGGDRDRGKRPLMGKIAEELADRAIVTDDNPRSEEAGTIRAEILAGMKNGRAIGDRAEAIARAVAELAAGDVLVIAGKGHEQGQIVGGKTLPFDDATQARAAIARLSPDAPGMPHPKRKGGPA